MSVDGTSGHALAIVGATASGKTRLALEVALALGAEIVNMDSRQVYRGMDVGTAKPTPEERARVPHHGLDVVDPDQPYSAGRFARDARGWITEIGGRGRVALLVGGTGFFLRALTRPMFRQPALDAGRLAAVRGYLSRQSRGTLESWVRVLDPERAEVAAQGGPQRLGRTLEVALVTGRPLTWWHRHAPADGPRLGVRTFVLELPREVLDRRIEERAAAMIERGLVEEVAALMAAGYGTDAPAMSATGYREIAAHVAGESTLKEATNAMIRSTRRYARRQLTWFRNQVAADAVRVDGSLPLDQQVASVLDTIHEREEGVT